MATYGDTYTAIWWCQKSLTYNGKSSRWQRTGGKIQVGTPDTKIDQVRSPELFYGLFLFRYLYKRWTFVMISKFGKKSVKIRIGMSLNMKYTFVDSWTEVRQNS